MTKTKTKIDRTVKTSPERPHVKLNIIIVAWIIMAIGVLNVLDAFGQIFAEEALEFLHFYIIGKGYLSGGAFLLAILGTLMIAIGYSLFKMKKDVWYVVMGLLPATIIINLMLGSVQSFVLAFLSVGIMMLLWYGRDQFKVTADQFIDQKRAISLFLSMTTFAVGVIGSKMIGDQFEPKIVTWVDAIYYTTTVITTLGIGDFRPATDDAKMFTVLLVMIGFAAFVAIISTFVTPYLEKRMTRMVVMLKKISDARLKDHVIICGLSDESWVMIRRFLHLGTPFIVITRVHDEEVLDEFEALGVRYLIADPSDEDTLVTARVSESKGVIAASNDDAHNAFIAMTAKKVAPEVKVVAKAARRANISKMTKAGADVVISPSEIGANRMVGEVLGIDAVKGCDM